METVRIKELENIKKNEPELKNTITEVKNTLEGMNSRLSDTEKHTSDLEDTIMEITQSEQPKKKKKQIKTGNSLRDF